MRLSCLRKISLSLLWPHGLYLRLNLSKRWKVLLSAWTSKRSTLRSYLRKEKRSNFNNLAIGMLDWLVIVINIGNVNYPVKSRLSKTSFKVKYVPSLNMTTCIEQKGYHTCKPVNHMMAPVVTSSGSFLSFDLINLKRCFWFMQAEWWTWVSTFLTL